MSFAGCTPAISRMKSPERPGEPHEPDGCCNCCITPTLRLQGEACFVSSDGAAQSSTCCGGFSCQPDAAVQLESAVAVRLLGGSPGVCRRSSATLNA